MSNTGNDSPKAQERIGPGSGALGLPVHAGLVPRRRTPMVPANLREENPKAVSAAEIPQGVGGTDCPRGQNPGAAVDARGRPPALKPNTGAGPPGKKTGVDRPGNGRWESGAENASVPRAGATLRRANPRSAAGAGACRTVEGPWGHATGTGQATTYPTAGSGTPPYPRSFQNSLSRRACPARPRDFERPLKRTGGA